MPSGLKFSMAGLFDEQNGENYVVRKQIQHEKQQKQWISMADE